MGTYLSPEDPIFWLHHCNIDRLWASWAALHGNRVPGQALWANHKLTQFYDPKQRAQVSADTSQMKNAEQFNAVYDKLETLTGTPQPALISKLGDFVLGTQTQMPQALAGKALGAEAAAPATSSGNVVTFRVQPEQRLGEALARAGAEGVAVESRPETYLLIEGVPKPGNPGTGLRVFLNAKNPGTATAVTDPGYAGTLAFFGDSAHANHGGGARTFVLDVQESVSSTEDTSGYGGRGFRGRGRSDGTRQRGDRQARESEAAGVLAEVRMRGALFLLLFIGLACGEDRAGTKSFTVRPSTGSGEQLLHLRGVKLPAGVQGLRVYLNPKKNERLSEQSASYIGNVNAPQRAPGAPASGDFVLTLPARVSGTARVVVEAFPAVEGAGRRRSRSAAWTSSPILRCGHEGCGT